MSLSDQTKTWSPAGQTTVQTLLDALGLGLLHVLVAPRGLDIPVRGTAIFDPADPVPDGQDRILMLVGTRVDQPTAVEAVREAAHHGFIAVVVKLRGGSALDVVTEASAQGLAVLTTADDMPWRHLDGLMASVLGAGRLPAEVTSSGGEALFALANALSAIIGGSVAIEDLEQHVLAYSSSEDQRIDPLRERGILDRQVPDLPHHRAQYLQVLRTTGLARFPALDDELPRVAVAVRAGDLPLGTIWAIEGVGGLQTEGEKALLDGARIAALHMLRGQDALEREQHLRGEVLRAVLGGAHSAQDAGERLGLAPGQEYALIAFSLVGPADNGGLMPRVGNSVTRYALAYRPEAITTTMPHAVYVLAPGPAPSVRRLAEGVIPTLRNAAGAPVRGAVSAVSRDPAELMSLRREVDAVLRAASSDSRAPLIATVADVHSRMLLDRLTDQLAHDPRLRHPGVDLLTEHDRDRGSSYGATARAWLDAQCDVVAAAELLSIHPNTLRYRLRRLQERFGLDLADPDIRLSVWLQLRSSSASESRP